MARTSSAASLSQNLTPTPTCTIFSLQAPPLQRSPGGSQHYQHTQCCMTRGKGHHKVAQYSTVIPDRTRDYKAAQCSTTTPEGTPKCYKRAETYTCIASRHNQEHCHKEHILQLIPPAVLCAAPKQCHAPLPDIPCSRHGIFKLHISPAQQNLMPHVC